MSPDSINSDFVKINREIILSFQRIEAIHKASNDVKSSQKFKVVYEVILAFGNYLNSSKKGIASGFKLQTLDRLRDIKSIDKQMCLLHYIVETIHPKFTDLSNFDTEISSINGVLVENVVADVFELEKGMEMASKVGDKGEAVAVLRDFLNNSQEKMNQIKRGANEAQIEFNECVQYFGESPDNANEFFSTLVRFTKAVKVLDMHLIVVIVSNSIRIQCRPAIVKMKNDGDWNKHLQIKLRSR